MNLTQVIEAISDLNPDDMAPLLAAIAAKLAGAKVASVVEPASEPAPALTTSADHLLTTKEAADILRKNPKWIYRHRDYPFVRRIGGSLLVSQRALDRWIEPLPSKIEGSEDRGDQGIGGMVAVLLGGRQKDP